MEIEDILSPPILASAHIGGGYHVGILASYLSGSIPFPNRDGV